MDSAWNAPDGKVSGSLRLKITRTKYTNGTFPNRKDSMMSKTVDRTTFPTWMQSLAGFLAKTLASLGAPRVSTPNAQVYSSSSLESLASYDPDGGFLRMSQISLLEMMDAGSPPSCQKWPRSGMMRAGTVYRLPPLTRHIDVIESGLLHTPTATANQDCPSMRGRDKGNWWPTPKAQNANAPAEHGQGGRDLQTEVRMWPTPTHRDFRDSGENTNYKRGAKRFLLAPTVKVSQPQTQGNLNPDWVEVYLMGLPDGWTNLPTSRERKRRRRAAQRGSKPSAMD